MIIGVCNSKRIRINKVIGIINRKMISQNWDIRGYLPDKLVSDILEGCFNCDIFIMDLDFDDSSAASDEYSLVNMVSARLPKCHIILFSVKTPDYSRLNTKDNIIYVRKESRNNRLVRILSGYIDEENSDTDYLKINYRRKKRLLRCIDIIMIKTEGRMTKYYTSVGDFTEYKTLVDVEALLPACFVRCNSSTIVNMTHHVKMNHSEIHMDNGSIVRIGRAYKKRVFQVDK